MNLESTKSKKVDVRRMAVIGILSAISIMLAMTPLGFIPLGITNPTIMYIPVVIGAIMEGPVAGMAIGFIFGCASLLRALTVPSPVNFAFMDPIVSILPRVLIGILTYYIFEGTLKLSKNVRMSGMITGAMGALINTVGVLGMVYLRYGERYAQAMNESADAAFTVIATIAVTNGIPEMIIGALAVSSIIIILKKSKK